MTEFDAARSELVLARAVVLVEGLTEKLVLPFVFSALGHDVDQDAISIVEIAETAGEEHVVVLDPTSRRSPVFAGTSASRSERGGNSPSARPPTCLASSSLLPNARSRAFAPTPSPARRAPGAR